MFQCVSPTVYSVPLPVSYVSPHSQRSKFDLFFSLVSPALRGSGVLFIDLNSRHKALEKIINTSERHIHLWEESQNFKTKRTRMPTFTTLNGTSILDRFQERASAPSLLTLEEPTVHDDHCAFISQLTSYTLSTLPSMLISMMMNEKFPDYAVRITRINNLQ